MDRHLCCRRSSVPVYTGMREQEREKRKWLHSTEKHTSRLRWMWPRGAILPRRIWWDNGVIFQIDQILYKCRATSKKVGGGGIQKSLSVWKPELERYAGLVQQIKEKSKERKALVAEKKELPIYHVKRHKALTVRIAELTEDLEELRSEKALLLQKFEYAEDAGAEAFRKDIAIMEAGLKKLEAQEQKNATELDKALAEYADLKAQAADFDPVELYKARNAIRPVQEKTAEQRLEDAIHEKPSLIMLLSAKQETSRLLGEDAEERQAVQLIIHRNQELHRNSHSKRKRNDPER